MKVNPKKLKKGQTRIEAFHWVEQAKKEVPFVKRITRERAKKQPLDQVKAGIAQLEMQMRSYKNAARPDIVEKLRAERDALQEEVADRKRMYERAGIEERWDGFDLHGLKVMKKVMEENLQLLIRRNGRPEEIRRTQNDIKILEKTIAWKEKQ